MEELISLLKDCVEKNGEIYAVFTEKEENDQKQKNSGISNVVIPSICFTIAIMIIGGISLFYIIPKKKFSYRSSLDSSMLIIEEQDKSDSF